MTGWEVKINGTEYAHRSFNVTERLNEIDSFNAKLLSVGATDTNVATGNTITFSEDGTTYFNGVIEDQSINSNKEAELSGIRVGQYTLKKGYHNQRWDDKTAGSAIVKDIVNPISGVGIGTNSESGSITFRAEHEHPMNALGRLAKDFGDDWWTDGSANFNMTEAKGSATSVKTYEVPINASIVDKEERAGKTIDKVIILGAGDGTKMVVGSAGSGDNVKIFADPSIRKQEEADKLAQSFLNVYSTKIETIDLNPAYPIEFYETGDAIHVTDSNSGVDNDYRLVTKELSVNPFIASEDLSLELSNKKESWTEIMADVKRKGTRNIASQKIVEELKDTITTLDKSDFVKSLTGVDILGDVDTTENLPNTFGTKSFIKALTANTKFLTGLGTATADYLKKITGINVDDTENILPFQPGTGEFYPDKAGDSSTESSSGESASGGDKSSNTWDTLTTIDPGSSDTQGMMVVASIDAMPSVSPSNGNYIEATTCELELYDKTNSESESYREYFLSFTKLRDTNGDDVYSRKTTSVTLYTPENTAGNDYEVRFNPGASGLNIGGIIHWQTVARHTHRLSPTTGTNTGLQKVSGQGIGKQTSSYVGSVSPAMKDENGNPINVDLTEKTYNPYDSTSDENAVTGVDTSVDGYNSVNTSTDVADSYTPSTVADSDSTPGSAATSGSAEPRVASVTG